MGNVFSPPNDDGHLRLGGGFRSETCVICFDLVDQRSSFWLGRSTVGR